MNYTDNIELFKKWVWIILLTCTLIELLFFPKLINFYGCLCFMYGWLLVDKLVFTRRLLNSTFFLPVFCIFGLAICYYFLALPVTLIEGKPLTFNFSVPELTWFNQALYITSIVLAFRLCVIFYNSNNIFHRLWKYLGFFISPSANHVWILGFVGCFFLLLSVSFQGDESMSSKELGFVGGMITFLRKYAVFPVCLLLVELYRRKRHESNLKLPLIVYIIFLFVIGVATTRRALMLNTLATLGFGYIAYFFLKNKPFFNPKWLFGIVIGVYLLTGPVADFSLAMTLNRQVAMTSSIDKSYDAVISLLRNREKLKSLSQNVRYKLDNGGDNTLEWSEYYVDNIFLDRFCNLRVIDASIFYAQDLGYGKSKRMQEYSNNFFIRRIPSFLLPGDLEKKYITSAGDVLSSEGTSQKYLHHGYRVAGDTGVGLSLWGYSYYMINIVTMFALFYFFSSIVTMRMGQVVIPLPVLGGTIGYFMYFCNAWGIFKSFDILLRSGWTEILFYCAIFFVVRKFFSL